MALHYGNNISGSWRRSMSGSSFASGPRLSGNLGVQSLNNNKEFSNQLSHNLRNVSNGANGAANNRGVNIPAAAHGDGVMQLPANFNLKPPLRGTGINGNVVNNINILNTSRTSSPSTHSLRNSLQGHNTITSADGRTYMQLNSDLKPLQRGAGATAGNSTRLNLPPDMPASSQAINTGSGSQYNIMDQRASLGMVNQTVNRSVNRIAGANAYNRTAGSVGAQLVGGYGKQREYYEKLADEAARRHGLDPHLVRAVITAESNFNPKVVSAAGAMGLMQLMPGTAQDMKVSDPFDPKQNIEGGTKYLAWLSQQFKGDESKILAAYNWGPGNVTRGGHMPLETRNYLVKVRQFRDAYQQLAAADKQALQIAQRTDKPAAIPNETPMDNNAAATDEVLIRKQDTENIALTPTA